MTTAPAPPSSGGPARARQRVEPALRPMRRDDLEAILEMERLSFEGIPPERQWTRGQVLAHVERFPEGQWVAELDGRVVGSCTNMLTTWERAMRPHTWHEITGGGLLRAHDPGGDVLYGTEIMVHPDARRRGIGRRLFERRYRFVVDRGLRAFVTGGRLPGYHQHAARMKCRDYVAAVARDDLVDPVLTADIRWGAEPRGVLCDYMLDPDSLHHAALVVWENPEWPPAGEREGVPVFG